MSPDGDGANAPHWVSHLEAVSGVDLQIFFENFSDSLNGIAHGIFGTAVHRSDLVIGVLINRIEQKTLPLNRRTTIQNGQELCQGFPLANDVLRSGLVGQKSLGGNYVFVELTIILMPSLFMVKILGLALALVVTFGHVATDFNGHHAPIDFDGDLHLAFSFRSVL